MAVCPSCKQTWQWDWEQDTFRTPEGKECKVEVVKVTKLLNRGPKEDVEGVDTQTTFRCLCGLRLGMMSDWDGMDAEHEPKEWQKLSWEEPEDYYGSNKW